MTFLYVNKYLSIYLPFQLVWWSASSSTCKSLPDNLELSLTLVKEATLANTEETFCDVNLIINDDGSVSIEYCGNATLFNL